MLMFCIMQIFLQAILQCLFNLSAWLPSTMTTKLALLWGVCFLRQFYSQKCFSQVDGIFHTPSLETKDSHEITWGGITFGWKATA
jgi:hypothetical protein